MTVLKNRYFVFSAMILSVLALALLFPQSVSAQDDSRFRFDLKLGKSAAIGDLSAARVNAGFSVGYKPIKKLKNFYVEPGFSMAWPKKEDLDYYGDGYIYRYTTRVVLLDGNATYEFPNKTRFHPYVTGGIGLLRASASLTDGYGLSQGSLNRFSKNFGTGLKYVIKEKFAVGAGMRQYYTSAEKFKIYSAEVSFRF